MVIRTEILGPGGTKQPTQTNLVANESNPKENKSKTIIEVMPFWYVPVSFLAIYGLYKIIRS